MEAYEAFSIHTYSDLELIKALPIMSLTDLRRIKKELRDNPTHNPALLQALAEELFERIENLCHLKGFEIKIAKEKAALFESFLDDEEANLL